MKPRSFDRFLTAASLAALLAGSAQAIILPPMDDTSGTRTLPPSAPPKAPLTSASGIATSLPVSRTRTALIRFDAGTAGISAASVTQARLTIYIPSVKVRGALSFHVVNQDWSETFVEKARPLPALAPAFVTLPSASVVQKQFIVLDVTTQVKAWLAAPSTDFGFAVASPDGVASLALSSKEGPASGPAAVLEIDTDVSSGTAPVAGSTGSFTGNVGIGTSTPGSLLQVGDFGGGVDRFITVASEGGNAFRAGIKFRHFNNSNGFTIESDERANGNPFGLNFLEHADDLAGVSRFYLEKGGNVGIGTTDPTSKLTVNGQIETSSGLRFPDGSVQTKAAPGTGATSQFLNLGPGSFISEDSANRVVNSTFDGVWTTTGRLIVPLRLPSGAKVLSVKAYVNDTVPGVNLRVQNLTKKSSDSNSVGSAIDFEVLAASSGYFNQTATPTFDLTISSDSADFLIVRTVGGEWPGNATLAVQNITVEWRMP